jgi:hypothetical protein
MSLDDDAALTRFALLDGFFRRPDGAVTFYCATCLVVQLRAHGSRAFSLAAVQGAIKDAFKRPGELQLRLVGTCDACQKPRSCVGAARPG